MSNDWPILDHGRWLQDDEDFWGSPFWGQSVSHTSFRIVQEFAEFLEQFYEFGFRRDITAPRDTDMPLLEPNTQQHRRSEPQRSAVQWFAKHLLEPKVRNPLPCFVPSNLDWLQEQSPVHLPALLYFEWRGDQGIDCAPKTFVFEWLWTDSPNGRYIINLALDSRQRYRGLNPLRMIDGPTTTDAFYFCAHNNPRGNAKRSLIFPNFLTLYHMLLYYVGAPSNYFGRFWDCWRRFSLVVGNVRVPLCAYLPEFGGPGFVNNDAFTMEHRQRCWFASALMAPRTMNLHFFGDSTFVCRRHASTELFQLPDIDLFEKLQRFREAQHSLPRNLLTLGQACGSQAFDEEPRAQMLRSRRPTYRILHSASEEYRTIVYGLLRQMLGTIEASGQANLTTIYSDADRFLAISEHRQKPPKLLVSSGTNMTNDEALRRNPTFAEIEQQILHAARDNPGLINHRIPVDHRLRLVCRRFRLESIGWVQGIWEGDAYVYETLYPEISVQQWAEGNAVCLDELCGVHMNLFDHLYEGCTNLLNYALQTKNYVILRSVLGGTRSVRIDKHHIREQGHRKCGHLARVERDRNGFKLAVSSCTPPNGYARQ